MGRSADEVFIFQNPGNINLNWSKLVFQGRIDNACEASAWVPVKYFFP